MAKKRTYSTHSVESVPVDVLLPALLAGCIVALDVAKQKFVFAVATLAGEVIKLFRFEHPKETGKFFQLVEALKERVEPGKLKVAMEPTGTYGDGIRHQLASRGIPVWMVSPKKTFDSRALFDDVQSLHDPKSAVHVAKLCALNLATEWHAPPELRVRLRALVQLRAHEHDSEERCFGRMEALLARHWPEFGQWLDVRGQKSALVLLAKYPSPESLNAARENAEVLLREVSRSRLSEEKIRGFLAASVTTLGVPALPEETRMLAALAEQAAEAQRRANAVELDMTKLGSGDEVFQRLERWMGTFSAAVIITMCDPRQYEKPRQLEKACGLNLREKSSGNDPRDVGLHITKRGPSLVRKVLFLFALRMIKHSPEARAWYMRRRSFAGGAKMSSVIALMRKLVRAVFYVARGADFDPSKLFDLRRLEVPTLQPEGAVLRRKVNEPKMAAAVSG